MNHHIQQTIEDLKMERSKLDELIVHLEQYSAARFASPPPVASAPIKAPRKYTKRAEAQSAPSRSALSDQPAAPEPVETAVKLEWANKATTAAGATKQIIADAHSHGIALSVDKMETALKQLFPEIKDTFTALHARVSYWAATGKMEKIGSGNLASYRVLDEGFFKTLVAED